jgi:hypothetical protein
MILLSQQRWTPTAIAELLGCDPRTVRRWVHRYNQHGTPGLTDRPRPGRPRLGSPRLGDRIRRLLAHPRAWTVPRLGTPWAGPRCVSRTLPPPRARSRLLAAAGRQGRPGRRADPGRTPPGPCRPAGRGGGAGRGRTPPLPAAPPCAPPGSPGAPASTSPPRAPPAADHLWRGRPGQRPLLLPGGPQGHQCHLHRLPGTRPGRLPDRARRRRRLRQRAIHRSKLVPRWLAAHPRVVVLHGARYRPTTTRSSASGARSRRGRRTRRR